MAQSVRSCRRGALNGLALSASLRASVISLLTPGLMACVIRYKPKKRKKRATPYGEEP
jgi:hypothetical protein